MKDIDLSNSADILNKAHIAFKKYLNNFKLNKVYNKLKFQNTNFTDIYEFTKHISESFFINLNEDEQFVSNQIVSIHDLVNELKDKYNLFDYQFFVYSPNNVEIVKIDKIPNYLKITHSILIQNIKDNINIIKKELNNFGYYCVLEREYVHDNISYIMLVFDPYKQENISEMIINSKTYIYHFSSSYNHESILKNGFIPKNEGRLYKYANNRIYFITCDPKSNDFKKMLHNISVNRKRLNDNFNGAFMIYRIDVDKLENVTFYYDPHGRNCIYTTENISSNVIDGFFLKQT